MRFAIMEAKMALINVLKRFIIARCDETQVPMEMTKNGLRGPAKGVTVKVIERE